MQRCGRPFGEEDRKPAEDGAGELCGRTSWRFIAGLGRSASTCVASRMSVGTYYILRASLLYTSESNSTYMYTRAINCLLMSKSSELSHKNEE